MFTKILSLIMCQNDLYFQNDNQKKISVPKDHPVDAFEYLAQLSKSAKKRLAAA